MGDQVPFDSSSNKCVTNQRTYLHLTWVGSRDTCVSKQNLSWKPKNISFGRGIIQQGIIRYSKLIVKIFQTEYTDIPNRISWYSKQNMKRRCLKSSVADGQGLTFVGANGRLTDISPPGTQLLLLLLMPAPPWNAMQKHKSTQIKNTRLSVFWDFWEYKWREVIWLELFLGSGVPGGLKWPF